MTERTILCVDDDAAVLRVLRQILEKAGFATRGAGSAAEALAAVAEITPALILLDVRMPEMDGYELCRRLQSMPRLAGVPILFVTVMTEEGDQRRAREAGGLMVLSKPIDRSALLQAVRDLAGAVPEPTPTGASWSEWVLPETFNRFRAFLEERLAPTSEQRVAIRAVRPHTLYDLAGPLDLRPREMAEHIAEFLGVPYIATVDPASVELGLLTGPFCRANFIVPVRDGTGLTAVVSNPFDWDLLDAVRRVVRDRREPALAISEPGSIQLIFTRRELEEARETDDSEDASRLPTLNADTELAGPGDEIRALSNQILRDAVVEGASDLHIEPKRDDVELRLRVDGDVGEARTLTQREGTMLIARLKALARLDIAEKRKPQDGAMEAVVEGRRYKLRLATTVTPHGESLVIRILEPGSKPPTLEALGLTTRQSATLVDLITRSSGLILVVGPTGSGKSTTIFSLLAHLQGSQKSIITVEDPVEYSMPFANQQQVNDQTGATFEALLRSAVRQDPDVLLIGEIRDLFSAKAGLDFSSSGHLTVSTIHSSNATTAIFRLERLGVERGFMADALLCVVAQKLVKRLCERCRVVRSIRPEEQTWLRPFTSQMPTDVAEPAGCPSCRGTGYRGREAVCEILVIDTDVRSLIRRGASIAEIRTFVAARGDTLLAQHAVEKVRAHVITPADAQRLVLAEESAALPPRDADIVADGDAACDDVDAPMASEWTAKNPPTLLVVDDDQDTRMLLNRLLDNVGYAVVLADDGLDALLKLGQRRFDLILSDIDMPNLDGLKLLEVLTQKGVETPVVFLTAQTDEAHEVRGLKLGAVDYLYKPVRKEVLRMRVARALHQPGSWTPAGAPATRPGKVAP